MTETKIVTAYSMHATVYRDPHVVHTIVRNGVLVCAMHASSKSGGVLLIENCSEQPAGALESAIRDFASKFASKIRGVPNAAEMQTKLLFSADCHEAVRKLLSQYGFTVVGETKNSVPMEAYYFTDSGRLRIAPASDNHVVAAAEDNGRKKRVLIVDDSKTIRQLLTKILSSDAHLEVVGAAELPSHAEKMIEELKPDVITLDINMPEMDGVTLLQRYIGKYPIPTVMISAISMEEGNQVLRALEIGAVDYIQKPSFEELDRMAPLIIEKVRTASAIRVRGGQGKVLQNRLTSGVLNHNIVVAVGASTGGTEALRHFFSRLPSGIPPIVVVQHIPPVFSRAFANRLAELCPFEVKEAENGDVLKPDRVLIAPGGLQMAVERGGPTGLRVNVFNGEPVNRHKPSVDVLFDSVAKELGKKAIGIIMTGMGRDGAAGMLRMHQAGARTIAQDEASCVVFGMPKEAIKLGGAEAIHPLDKIPEILTSWLHVNSKPVAAGF